MTSFVNLFHKATRNETLQIKLITKINKDSLDFLKDKTNTLKLDLNFWEKDKLSLDWKFDISYLNGIEKRMEAILELLNHKDTDIIQISKEELNDNRCIIEEMLNIINKMIEICNQKAI